MYECEKCQGLFDAGELHGGICDDCREAEEQQDLQRELNRQMRKRCIREQEDGQLVFL